MKEQYQPSPSEIRKAEGIMSDEQKKQSEDREDALFEGMKMASTAAEKENNMTFKEKFDGGGIDSFEKDIKLAQGTIDHFNSFLRNFDLSKRMLPADQERIIKLSEKFNKDEEFKKALNTIFNTISELGAICEKTQQNKKW